MTSIEIPDRSIEIPDKVLVGTPFTVGVGVINKEINEPILQGSNCGTFLGGDGEKVDVTLNIEKEGITLVQATNEVCALYGLETIDLAQQTFFENIVIQDAGKFNIFIEAETQRKLGEGNFASAGPFTVRAVEEGISPPNGDEDDEDFNLIEWATNNPGQAAVAGVGGAIAIRSILGD